MPSQDLQCAGHLHPSSLEEAFGQAADMDELPIEDGDQDVAPEYIDKSPMEPERFSPSCLLFLLFPKIGMYTFLDSF